MKFRGMGELTSNAKERNLRKKPGKNDKIDQGSDSCEKKDKTRTECDCSKEINKAGYTATPVACGWAGTVPEKVTRAFGHEQKAQKAQKRQKRKKEGRLHGYPSRVRMGRSSAGEVH